MADEEPKAPQTGATDDEDAPASTPFDSPWFIPVLLWAGAVWFGYDIVTDAEAYQKYPNFNRYGFLVLLVGAIWFSWKAIREKRADAGGPSAGE